MTGRRTADRDAGPGLRPVPRAVRGLLGAAVAVAVGYTASTLAPGPQGVAGDIVYVAAFAVGAAACAARAARVRDERLAWALIAAALATTGIGELLWSLAAAAGEVPTPSAADAFFLAFYPLAYVALTRLVRDRIPHVHAGMWLDGLVSGLAVTSLVAALAFDAIIDRTGGAPLEVATTLAYPIGDLLLVLLVAGAVGLTGGRLGLAWSLLGVGLLAWGVADALYAAQGAQGTYVEGTLVDAGWPVGAALIALAAWTRPQPPVARGGDWTALVVPSVSMVVAGGVLTACAAESGRTFAVVLASSALTSAVVRTAMTFREVRRLAETRRLAMTDELTGLANRRALMARLTRAADAYEPVALLMIDFDRFKELNDTLGHHVGDELLSRAGPAMRGTLRPGDLLARLGGDEFAAVLEGGIDAAAAQRAAERLLRRLGRPFVLGGVPVVVDASVGVALMPEHAATPTDLLRHADIAMYEAKKRRSGIDVYTPGTDRHSRRRLALAAEIREAVTAGQIVVHLQPQVDADTAQLLGAEALVRWQHPEHGLLMPGAFLPGVEHTNVMRPLTDHVIAQALTLAAAARASGTPLPIAVNVAPQNLLDLDFPRRVAALLVQHGATARDLRLEVTEQGVMVDTDRAIAVLGHLRRLGVQLAIDDFGTGHSSLARIRDLPVDELKIDRSFVQGIGEHRSNDAIVRAAATLGRELGLVVVAEGVETGAQWDVVRDAGCDVVQGFLVARPMPCDDFGRWAAIWSRDVARAAA